MLPHVLFKLNTFIESQEQFGDQFVPEVKQLYDHPQTTSVNLNNVYPFDLLLTHWETSFKSAEDSHLRLPSMDTLRIILTLAARCTRTNWTNNSITMEGVTTTNSYAKSMNNDYNNTLYKASFQSRSLWLLENYRDLLVGSIDDLSDPILNILYTKLNDLLLDFIVLLWPIAKSVKLDDPIIKISKSERLPVKSQSRITNFFNADKSDHIADDENEQEYVSDSEHDVSMLNSTANMQQELDKYKYVLKSTSFGDIFSSGEPLKTTKRTMTDPARASKSRKLQFEDTLPIWSKIKVFDEPLLSVRLNPKLNSKSKFNLWLLVNWAFSCAEKSLELQATLPNASFSIYHNIFQTHNDLINVIFDLIEVNFFVTFKRHEIIQANIKKLNDGDILAAHFNTPTKTRKLILFHLEDSTFQIYTLLGQLSNKQVDWYDRLVEYVFNGLGLKSNLPPQSLYEREKLLIKRDEIKKESFNMEDFLSEQYTDDLVSMITRYKIILFVFYRALFFSNGEFFGLLNAAPETYLKPRRLLVELSQKFLVIGFKYLREFYYSEKVIKDRTLVPKKYQTTLLLELAQVLILDITKVVEHEKLTIKRYAEFEIIDTESLDSFDDITLTMSESDIEEISNPNTAIEVIKPVWQIENVKRLLETLVAQDNYLSLVEDDTYKTALEFKELWLKVFFLLEWMLHLVLQDYEEYGSTDVELGERIIEMSTGGDDMRSLLFERFVQLRTQREGAFILSEEDVEELRTGMAELCGFHAIAESVLR